jgi:putative colanic acid biosynthesis UDP-glucose lipid carrier transferase
VLIGDMSLVGPRPHAVGHDAELIGKLDEYAYRNRLKPGITGWAQVNGHRGEIRTPEQIEARAQHDLYYIDNWTIFLDIWVIFLTVFSPRTHRGVF